MKGFPIFLDEDSCDSDLVAALRNRHVDVLSVLEAKLQERSDEEQLVWATNAGRIIVRSKIVVPSRDQFQALIRPMRDEDGSFGTQGKGRDAFDLVELLAYSGARLAECSNWIAYSEW